MRERDFGSERQHVHVVRAEDELVRIALSALRVDVTFRSGAAALDGDDDRLAHEIVLLNGSLHRAREDIRAAAGPRRHHEFHGF